MQPANLVAQRWQVGQLQLPVGTPFAAKAVLRRAIGAHGYHRQGGRRVELNQKAFADTFVFQYLLQAPSKVIGGQAGEEPRLDPQAAQTHRDVERRATGNRLVIELGGLPAGILLAEEIKQRFTTHQIHSCSLLKGCHVLLITLIRLLIGTDIGGHG